MGTGLGTLPAFGRGEPSAPGLTGLPQQVYQGSETVRKSLRDGAVTAVYAHGETAKSCPSRR
jgi:hypothetical protein